MSDLMVLFEVSGRRAALPAAEVAAVVDLGEVVAVPGAPDHILGLAALRSQVVTVVDVALALGEGQAGSVAAGRRAVVVDHAGHRYALVAEEIEDVAHLVDGPAPVPGGLGGAWAAASAGLCETDRGPALLLRIAALVEGVSERAQ